MLENNASETQVLQFIEKDFCNNLGALSQICVQFIEQNGRELLYELGKKIVKKLKIKNAIFTD
jgi:hypothetical protein